MTNYLVVCLQSHGTCSHHLLSPCQILVAIEQVQDLLPKIEQSRSEPSLHRAVNAEDLNPLLFHTTRLLPL